MDTTQVSRYQAPSPKGSPYITEDGYRALCDEMDALLARRRDVVVHLSAAAAEGDRSENAEYIYRKKQLREMDRRIGYLQRRLPSLTVVKKRPDNPTRVRFGASVTLCDELDEEHDYRIVGTDESDPSRGRISVDSPMARALLNREVEDEVRVQTPKGMMTYRIVAVQYEQTGSVTRSTD